DADDLARAHRLREYAVDRRTDEAIMIVDRDHYRDVGCGRIVRRSRKSRTHRRARIPRPLKARNTPPGDGCSLVIAGRGDVRCLARGRCGRCSAIPLPGVEEVVCQFRVAAYRGSPLRMA